MVFLILLCLLLAAIFGGGYYAYRVAFYSPTKGRDRIPAHEGPQFEPYRKEMARIFKQLCERSFEEVTIPSQDGLALYGRYYHVRDGAPLDICFHGYRSCALTDFSGGSELLFQLGHNVLLVDQRAHGKSQGHTIGFGVLERWDVLSWVDYALDRFGQQTEIVLMGVSMGAATVLMASDLGLPSNVKGIIADCPYASPGAIIRKVAGGMRIPVWLAWPFVCVGAKIYGGFNICEADAPRAVKNAPMPILLIHGESDNFVPCEMSEEIYRANPGKVQRHTFPGADHGLSYLADGPRYRQIVTAFMEKVL